VRGGNTNPPLQLVNQVVPRALLLDLRTYVMQALSVGFRLIPRLGLPSRLHGVCPAGSAYMDQGQTARKEKVSAEVRFHDLPEIGWKTT
jgi:hypothetical protein